MLRSRRNVLPPRALRRAIRDPLGRLLHEPPALRRLKEQTQA